MSTILHVLGCGAVGILILSVIAGVIMHFGLRSYRNDGSYA